VISIKVSLQLFEACISALVFWYCCHLSTQRLLSATQFDVLQAALAALSQLYAARVTTAENSCTGSHQGCYARQFMLDVAVLQLTTAQLLAVLYVHNASNRSLRRLHSMLLTPQSTAVMLQGLTIEQVVSPVQQYLAVCCSFFLGVGLCSAIKTAYYVLTCLILQIIFK
jgi:hypothetical protein